jgi:hypothetical protein
MSENVRFCFNCQGKNNPIFLKMLDFIGKSKILSDNVGANMSLILCVLCVSVVFKVKRINRLKCLHCGRKPCAPTRQWISFLFTITVRLLTNLAKMKWLNPSEVKLMTVRHPHYSKEEFARRGDEIYEYQVRSQVEAGNHGKIVAIDLESGDFEVDASEIAASDRLETLHPDAQIWIVRIGSRHVRRFGGRSK